MSVEKTLQSILDSIEYRMENHTRYDEYFIVIVNSDGEVIREFREDDYVAANNFFESLLTAEQLEALKIDAEIDAELILEAQANRELSY